MRHIWHDTGFDCTDHVTCVYVCGRCFCVRLLLFFLTVRCCLYIIYSDDQMNMKFVSLANRVHY